MLSSSSSVFDVTTSWVLISSVASLLDEVHPVKANINVRDNKTTNIFHNVFSFRLLDVLFLLLYVSYRGRLKKIKTNSNFKK